MSKIYDDILRELSAFWQEHHVPPTVRDLCSVLNIKSTSHIIYVLSLAEQKGEVRKVEGKYVPTWVDELFNKDSS